MQVPTVQAPQQLFYLREPCFEKTAEMSPALYAAFVEQDPIRKTKLVELKNRIRGQAGKLTVREYGATLAGISVDASHLPPDMTAEEQERLQEGTIRIEDWHLSADRVRTVVEGRGTAVLSGLEALGDMVLDDLWNAIEPELDRPQKALSTGQRMRVSHERFAGQTSRMFVGRTGLLAA